MFGAGPKVPPFFVAPTLGWISVSVRRPNATGNSTGKRPHRNGGSAIGQGDRRGFSGFLVVTGRLYPIRTCEG